jgi:hypothetical protein
MVTNSKKETSPLSAVAPVRRPLPYTRPERRSTLFPPPVKPRQTSSNRVKAKFFPKGLYGLACSCEMKKIRAIREIPGPAYQLLTAPGRTP